MGRAAYVAFGRSCGSEPRETLYRRRRCENDGQVGRTAGLCAVVPAARKASASGSTTMKRFEASRFAEEVGVLDVETVTDWEIQEYAAHL